MKKPNRRTISIASDRRARIPFAMIGVLVLITSTTAVTVLNSQEESTSETPDIGLAMDRTEAATQAATRDAVSEGLESAAQAPITETSNNAVGEAIEPDGTFANQSQRADAVFRRYIRLKIYQNAREHISQSDQRLQDGTTTNASLPAVGDTESEINESINRVEMDVGMYDDDVPDGQVQVALSGVNITVIDDNGTQVAQRTTTVNTSVPTTVFQLHEKTQEYETRLNTGFFEDWNRGAGYGFGRKFAVRQYPVSWAKVYFDRFTPANWDAAFDPVHDGRHTEILANSAVYDVQQSTFGTTDPYKDRIMRERWTCFALSTLYRIGQAYPSGDGNNLSEKPNTSTAFNETFSWAPTANDTNSGSNNNSSSALSAAAKQELTSHLPSNPADISEDDLCQATRLVLGDNSGTLPEAPSITELVGGMFGDKKGDTAEQNESEVKVDSFADAAYYQMQGKDVMAEIAGDLDSDDPDRNVDTHDDVGDTSPYSEHDTSNVEEPDRGSSPSDFDNEIETIIENTYEVDVSVSDSTSGDSVSEPRSKDTDEWSESGSGTSVNTQQVDVDVDTRNDTDAGSRDIELYDVDIEVENDITRYRNWTEDCNGNESGSECDGTDETINSRTITYTADITIEASHAPGTAYNFRGIEHAYEGGGPGPGGIPNYQDVKDQVIQDVFGTGPSGLQSTLRGRLSPGSITSESDFVSQISYTSSASADASLTSSDKDEVREWIREDINETRTELKDQVDSINVSRQKLATGDSNLDEIRQEVNNTRSSVIQDGVSGQNGKYKNPKERARAEAQNNYLDAVVRWTFKLEDEHADASREANTTIDDSLGGIDASVDKGLDFAQDALAGEVSTGTGDIAGTPQDRDAEIRIDASPSYLSRSSWDRSKEPAIRAEDEGPTDTDSTATHTGLTLKQDNVFLPEPGFPLIPWPGYWYGTLSSWYLRMDGEYARFSVTSGTSDPASSQTTYVRDDRPVEMDIGGTTMTAGSVEPIEFSSETAVITVVPSYQVAAYGSPGIGDSGRPWNSCTGTYPHHGPNAASESKDCPYVLDS